MKCIYFDIAELNINDNFNVAYKSIPWQNRLEKVDELKCQEDKLLSVGVSLLLAYMFKENGLDYAKLHCEDGGKPRLRGEQKLHFNCSHSGNLAVVAYSDNPVGVDVEKIRTVNQKVANRLFTENERKLVFDDESFLKIWTKKESYVKMTGEGRIQMACIEILPSSRDMKGLIFSEKAHQDHLITVCHSENEKADWKQVDFNELMKNI